MRDERYWPQSCLLTLTRNIGKMLKKHRVPVSRTIEAHHANWQRKGAREQRPSEAKIQHPKGELTDP